MARDGKNREPAAPTRGSSSWPNELLGLVVQWLATIDGAVALAFEVLLGLVADARAGSGTNGTADDRAGRPGNGATDGRAGQPASQGPGSGTGLVVALGRFTDDGAGDSADRAADDGPWGPPDGHADGCAAEDAGTSAHGFVAVLVGVMTVVVAKVAAGGA